MEISDKKFLGLRVAKAFGGSPKIQIFQDDNEESTIELLICYDRPQRGVTSYATVGLSDSPLIRASREYHYRVELVGACGAQHKEFPNILATAAFYIINSKMPCYPGAIFLDVVDMYGVSSTMSHILFVPPFLWEETLTTVEISGRTVAWLLAVPISDDERTFAVEHGSDELESLFEARQIDIYNLERPSVV